SAVFEALESESCVELVRLPSRNCVGERPPRCRRRLESPITPTTIDIETINRRSTDDWTAVHRHVHDASPASQHPQLSQHGELGQGRRHGVSHHRYVSPLGVTVVSIKVASHYETALV